MSSSIEKLTQHAREVLDALPSGRDALRIIDQLTAALEAAEQEKAELDDMVQVGATDILRERTRAEALQARVAELEAEVAIAWDDDAETGRANAAESELATAKARVAELEAKLSKAVAASSHKAQLLNERESELATAKARVAELEREVESADAGRDSAFDLIEQKNNELDAAHEALEIAESELADLRGRVARALTYTGQRREWAEIGPKMVEALRGR